MSFRSLDRLPIAFLALALAVSAWGCGGKRTPALANAQPEDSSRTAPRATGPVSTEPVDQGPDVRQIGDEGASGADISGGMLVGEGGPLGDIHFVFDSAALTDEGRAILEKHALWLQSHRDTRVTIEGHCDERGTTEYNLALGEQRARAAYDYLVSLGVAAARLRTVSYGKERPLDPGHDETAMARNRRDHFVVSP